MNEEKRELEDMDKKEKKIKKSKVIKEKKAKKGKWRLTKQERITWLADDEELTSLLCEKRIIEGGYAYLVSRNERWTDVHMKALIGFHKRMCFCVDTLTCTLFEDIRANKKTMEEAEQYMKMLQGSCVGLLLPVIDIIQGIVSLDEVKPLYGSFLWMENPEEMNVFLLKNTNYQKSNKKLEKLLKDEVDESQELTEYMSSLSPDKNITE